MDQPPAPERALLVAETGDWHARDSQYARSSRSKDYYDAFLRLIDEADARKIRVILNTGDLFHIPRPSTRVINQITRIHRRLQKKKIVMLTITGNHDWASPTWLETLFPDADPKDYGIVPMDDKRVTIDGFVFVGVRPMSPPVYRESRDDVVKFVEGADVLLFHGTVNGVVETTIPPATMLDISELPFVAGLKHVALGDLHFTGYVDFAGCLVGYPGSVEMGSSGEPTQKFMPLIQLTDKGAALQDMVPLSIRPFVARTVRTAEDLDALIEELRPLVAEHPVAIIDFSRELPQTVTRVYGLLDPQRAVIRCVPLPMKEEDPMLRQKNAVGDGVGIAHFARERFGEEHQSHLLAVTLELLERGESDADNIISDYIEKRKADLAVREEETPTPETNAQA